jgi:predicted restriction endonuclease
MHWLISANPKVYDHRLAFLENGMIDWRMSNPNYQIGDIVYIYTSRPEKKIQFKCVIEQVDMKFDDINPNDLKYWKTNENQSHRRFARMVLIRTFNDDLFEYETLMQNGLKGAPQNPNKLENNKKLLNYLLLNENKCARLFTGIEEKELNDNIVSSINNKGYTSIERQSIVKTRIGQGIYRSILLDRFDEKCVICGISGSNLLIASHIKAWSECEPGEHLNANNGLLLCPNHDKLFDSHLISFDLDGNIIIDGALSAKNKLLLGIESKINISLNDENQHFMEFHRTHFYRK